MIEFWNNLEQASKLAIIIAFIGWAIAFWQAILAYKRRKSAIIFENRLEIYNEYFRKLDSINESLTIDFSNFIGPAINQILVKILSEPEKANETMIELHKAASDIISKSANTISKTNQELQTLRFIASEKTIKILNEYKELAGSQAKIISELFNSLNISSFQSFDINKNSILKEIGKKLLLTKDKLEKQMRADLGLR